ncbi:MAG: translocation/assembly module TamB domain-containing protein [Candidatus Eisenbacteria sp.]|nr:translocation/assembly module TamB domain-containing protein [Candidatus Eisenbacteria bacterium]
MSEQQTSQTPTRPVRGRRRRRLGWGVLLLALAVLLASPFLIVRIASVRESLLRAGAGRLGLGPDERLRIGRVERFDPLHLSLADVAFETRDSLDWQPVTSVDRVRLKWSARSLLAGALGLSSLEVDSLRVWLPRAAAMRAARADPSPPVRRRTGGFDLPRFSIDRLRLSGLELIDQEGSRVRGDLLLAEIVSSPAAATGEVVSGALIEPRSDLEARFRDGRLFVRRGELIELRGLQVSTHASRLELRARKDLTDPEIPLRLDLTAVDLRPPLLDRVLPAFIEPAAGDSLTGSVELWFGRGHWLGDLSLAGHLAGEELAGLNALVEFSSDTMQVSNLWLEGGMGEISGRVIWDRVGGSLAVTVGPSRIDPLSPWLPWLHDLPHDGRAFGLSGEVTVRPREGRPTLIAGRCALTEAAPWGIETRVLRLRGSLETGRVLWIDAIDAELLAGRLHAEGAWTFDERDLDVRVVFDSVALGGLPEAWNRGLSGSLSGRLDLGGPHGDPELTGLVTGRRLKWSEWHADSLWIPQLRLRPGTLRGTGTIELAGVRRGAQGPAGRLSLLLAREQGSLAAVGRLRHPLLDAEVSASIDPQGSASLRRLVATSPQLGAWSLEHPVHLRWSPDSLISDTLRLASQGSRVDAALCWARTAGHIDGALRVDCFDLARLNGWLAGADSLRGRCDLQLSLEGGLGAPLLTLDVAGDEVEWGAIDLGRCRLQLAWLDSTLVLGPIEMHSAAHHLRVPQILMAPGATVTDWLQAAPDTSRSPAAFGRGRVAHLLESPWVGLIEVLEIDLAAYSGPLGFLPAVGEAGDGTITYLNVAGRRVPLRMVAAWDLGPGVAQRRLSGTLRGRLTFEGTPHRPALRAVLRVPELRFAQVPLGALVLNVAYHDSLARIEEFRLVRDDHTTWARGFYPVHFSLGPPAVDPVAAPVRVSAEIDQLDLALLSGLTRWLPDASGTLSGQVTLEGTGDDPQLRGTLSLSGGGLRIPGRSERIYEVEALLAIGPEGLRIRSLDARSGRRGTIAAVGVFRSSEDFDFSAVAEHVHIFEQGRYDILATGDLSAYTAPDPAGEIRPHLDGTIEVEVGTITQDFSSRDPASSFGQSNRWIIDLDVETAGNIRVSQVNTRAELGAGELQLVYQWPYWNASGSLDIVGGTYRLLNNVFVIQSGTVEFRDTGRGPDLTIAIDAETAVTVAGVEDAPSAVVTVEVQVYGKPEALEISLSSAPPLSEEEIVELLSIGRFSGTGTRFKAAAEETQWILLNTMVDRIEASLIEQSPFFSRVGIAAGTSGEDPLRVTVRPVMTSAVMVNYSQDLTFDPARELSMHYRLQRGFYLRAGIARDREGPDAFSEEYSLDLRYRFEYE